MIQGIHQLCSRKKLVLSLYPSPLNGRISLSNWRLACEFSFQNRNLHFPVASSFTASSLQLFCVWKFYPLEPSWAVNETTHYWQGPFKCSLWIFSPKWSHTMDNSWADLKTFLCPVSHPPTLCPALSHSKQHGSPSSFVPSPADWLAFYTEFLSTLFSLPYHGESPWPHTQSLARAVTSWPHATG